MAAAGTKLLLIRLNRTACGRQAVRPAAPDDKRVFAESELDPQGPLDHARSAAYHARSGANRSSRAAANGRGDLAKVSAALARDGVRKIGVVKEIEEVRPELQMDFFCAQREVFGNRKIEVGQARTVVLVAPGSPNSSRGRVRADKFLLDGVDGATEVPKV